MRRLVIPMMLVIAGVGALVGCFYVPTFEHPTGNNQRDFRKFLGPGRDMRIRPGMIDRRGVLALLGPAPLASADGRSIGYIYEVQHGVWVWPLCFGTVPGNNKVYSLRLDFGDDDMLQHFKTAAKETSEGSLYNSRSYPIAAAVNDLGEPNSPLLWHGSVPVKFDSNGTLLPGRGAGTRP
jgi:hypothetical protein